MSATIDVKNFSSDVIVLNQEHDGIHNVAGDFPLSSTGFVR